MYKARALALVMCLYNACCARASTHTHIQTDGANMRWCSSALHLALGYALIQQPSGPWSTAVMSCSKHALGFVFRGGVVGAQGILNHKNAEYLSPFPLPPPHLNQQCSWNEIQLGFQTFSYLIQFTSRLIAKFKTDFTPFLLSEMTKIPLNLV